MKFHNSPQPVSGKLDKKKGTIDGCSIITLGPCLGHGCEVDAKTLSGLFSLTKAQPVKSYWTHGGVFSGDRLGEEVGLFSAFRIEGQQLKATFQVFEAFRKNFAARWDYLTELVDKAPTEFGLSINFEGEAVWVLDNGAEVPADGGPKPANAVGDMPCVRVFKINSADFVSQPAANAGGMFAEGKITELLDLKQKLAAEISQLGEKLSAEGEAVKAKQATVIELTGKLEAASKTLEAERAAFAAKEADFSAQKNALEATITQLSANVATLTADVETRKNDAATKEAEYKAQIEALNKSLLEFGAVPVNLYSEVIDHKKTWAEITDPEAKTRYFRKHKAAILG